MKLFFEFLSRVGCIVANFKILREFWYCKKFPIFRKFKRCKALIKIIITPTLYAKIFEIMNYKNNLSIYFLKKNYFFVVIACIHSQKMAKQTSWCNKEKCIKFLNWLNLRTTDAQVYFDEFSISSWTRS